MDKATLVERDITVSALILEALSRTKIPVTLCEWRYVPQLDEWQLVIATPWLDQKGPRSTYRALIDAFTRAGIYDDVPMRRIFLMSPDDPTVRELEKESKTRNEGFVHILRHNGSPRAPADSVEFSVLFAPITGIGGPVASKHVTGDTALRVFLIDRLGIRRSVVDDALAELAAEGHSSIYPVNLTTREIKKVGLS